ncbi:hypothetical protein [Fischerella thermalis]|nr:hypothetical protein [Fischerella thermalis]
MQPTVPSRKVNVFTGYWLVVDGCLLIVGSCLLVVETRCSSRLYISG